MPERRSEFVRRRRYHWRLGQDVGAARGPYTDERNAECYALAAEAAGVSWAVEESDGVREEREAVVRWLRDQGPMASALADDIAAGDHRKGKSGA